MNYSENFIKAKKACADIISQSKNSIDYTHAENTLEWLTKLYGAEDEILCLAAFAHDIERAMPNRLHPKEFLDYDEYKRQHSMRSGEIVSSIAEKCGFSKDESSRLAKVIAGAEFTSTDPDIQKVCDADSISFFDNNLDTYRKKHDEKGTKDKVDFMYGRASLRAKKIIDGIIETSD